MQTMSWLYFIIADSDTSQPRQQDQCNNPFSSPCFCKNDSITPALSGHKMARGSLQAVEAGRFFACGGEHSGHGMLGTVKA